MILVPFLKQTSGRWQSRWKTEKERPESRRRIRKGLTVSEKLSEEEV